LLLNPVTCSPSQAVEPSQIECSIRQFAEEQKDANTDKHNSGKSLDPQQMPAESLKDGEKAA
jgi:hypothetical protein